MRTCSHILLLAILAFSAVCQSEYELEHEPWKWDPDFDEDQPYTFKRFVLYAPKGCGLDEMVGFKDWIDNYSAKFPELEMFSKTGDPYIRVFDKNNEVYDDIMLQRHDANEINKLLVALGAKYDKSLTWETRNQENKLRKAFYAPHVKKEDL